MNKAEAETLGAVHTHGNTRFFGSLRPSCLDFTFEKKYIIAEETKLIKNYKK